jgi:hypothetical protein
MSWNFYLKNKKVFLALELIESARKKGKKVVMHTTGDYGITIPFDDVYVLRASGYKTKRRFREYILPVFFDDPLKTYFGANTIIPRKKNTKPTVGFCGQARTDFPKEFAKTGRIALKNLLSYCKLRYEDPQSLSSSTLLRSKVLGYLQNSNDIIANFIIRDKYRAGAQSEKDRRKTSLEFYQNILESDYTVCVRGGGNFSKRFYETLAMGRIPLFINTDCNLPFDDEINWRQYCLLVEYSEISSIEDRVINHFENLDGDGFVNLQERYRALWDNVLSFGPFHRIFAKKTLLNGQD